MNWIKGYHFKEIVINLILVFSAVVGTLFFIKNWNRPITDATIFSTILVEVPIQVFIKRLKDVK